jgi:crotonobetainyl-CoA:carnitine CoA-transferase CaiB-like acyl-CoA transferase
MSLQALNGLRVIELGDMVSAAYATKLLADLGAEVIKVERPGLGDASRHYGPFPGDEPDPEKSGLFLYLNMNKLGTTLDPCSDSGKRILKELVDSADILVQNYPPSAAEEMGLCHPDLHETNPDLIMLSLSPYGQTGPYRDYKGYEINTASLGGVVMHLGLPGRAPLNPPQMLGHYQVAVTGAMAVMIALVTRDLSGTGQHIDLAEADSWATFHAGVGIVQWLFGLRTTMRHGRRVRGGPYPNTILPCKDGEIRMQAMTKREWNRILEMMGDPDWGHDPRFQDRLKMNEMYADELDGHIGAWLKKRTKQELSQLFYEYGVPFTPVNTIADFINDPHLAARGFFVEMEHPRAGALKYPGRPYQFSETPWEVRRPAPLLGEHNADVYCGLLGYDTRQLVRLRQSAVI